MEPEQRETVLNPLSLVLDARSSVICLESLVFS